MFENQINWNEPITIVEGVFDALSVKRNSIPILGKFIPKKLMENIYDKGVKTINILLDIIKNNPDLLINPNDVGNLNISDYRITMINSDYSLNFKVNRNEIFKICFFI